MTSLDQDIPQYAVLCGKCYYLEKVGNMYCETDYYKHIMLTFSFPSWEIYRYYYERDFIDLVHDFQELTETKKGRYSLEENIIELYKEISEKEAMKKKILYCVDDYPDENGYPKVYISKRDSTKKPAER